MLHLEKSELPEYVKCADLEGFQGSEYRLVISMMRLTVGRGALVLVVYLALPGQKQ